MALFRFIDHQFLSLPPKPTQDFRGKTIIVTGANTGLGFEACRWLIRQHATKIIMACRHVPKAQLAKERLLREERCTHDDVLEVWHLDMCSYDSVKAFASRASSSELARLDGVILNAGVWARWFRQAEENEESVTVNVISTFLLAFALLPKLSKTTDISQTSSNICIVSSQLHRKAEFKERNGPADLIFANLADQSSTVIRDRYRTTKLMQILLAREMARSFPTETHNVVINTVSPGWCKSKLGREAKVPWFILWLLYFLFARSAEVGARVLVTGLGGGEDTHGQYLPDGKTSNPQGLANDTETSELEDRMWTELLGQLENIRPGLTDLRLAVVDSADL